ncbi:MAG TPA: type I 3-dehydroquinate dehydratase, partial [Bacteroidales bacterium]|nr:type I 3-dehydroquinate dehydratase [Bacteroidales bacterium]
MKTKIFQTINIDDEKYINSLVKNYPYIELRLDYIAKTNLDNIFTQKNDKNEIIATLPIDGTNNTYAFAVLEQLINLGSDYIDINIESIEYKETATIINEALTKKCKTILSLHRIKDIISHNEIDELLKQQNEHKIDHLKIVLNPNNDDEYQYFCNLYKIYKNIIFLCIGKYSMDSRILAIKNEVPFIYTLSDG